MGISKELRFEGLPKPRTFSLGRLMLVVTLVCVVIGVAVRFSDLANATIAAIGWVGPTLVVLGILSGNSQQPRATVVAAVVGAIVVFCIVTPQVVQTPHRNAWSFWDLYAANYFKIAIPPALGAILLSGLYSIYSLARVK
jgi:hypothetical protein